MANAANAAKTIAYAEGPVVELVSPENSPPHKSKRGAGKPSKSKYKLANKNGSLTTSGPTTSEHAGASGAKSVWQKQQEVMRVLSVPKKQTTTVGGDRFEASETAGWYGVRARVRCGGWG